VGTVVGVSEGISVGCEVGLKDGSNVGSVVGVEVGANVIIQDSVIFSHAPLSLTTVSESSDTSLVT
jgi:hypothetical protein